MSDPSATSGKASPDQADKKSDSRGVNWGDPNVPAGNAPPLPRWPMVIAALAWFVWIVFLVVLLLTRADSVLI